MPSPFPGMDPYLEAHWLDVHGSLVHLAKAAIQPQLGDDLVARIEERIIVEDPLESSRRAFGPDVRVVEFGAPGTQARPSGSMALAKPIRFRIESEPVAQRYLEIRDLATDGRVVTVIEFLSPSNKLPGDGRAKYLRKQKECRDSGVNLVEIDLTRAGSRELLVYRWTGARGRDATYAVSVWRADDPTGCELYPVRLQDKLPAIAVPLRPGEPDIALDIQSLIESVYTASRYDRTTDYSKHPDPPLEAEYADWADHLLRAAGKR